MKPIVNSSTRSTQLIKFSCTHQEKKGRGPKATKLEMKNEKLELTPQKYKVS